MKRLTYLLCFLLTPTHLDAERIIPIWTGQHQVAPGWTSSEVQVPQFLKRGRIAGSVVASGGSGNDIRILIFTANELAKWKNRQPATPIYDSGQRRSIVLSVPITESGIYYVVYDNSFSLFSTKTLQTDLRLVYDDLDPGAGQQAQALFKARYEKMGQIVGKLTQSLQAHEKHLGTRQLRIPLKIGIENDMAVNAYADWRQNLIIMNRGFFDFAEGHGELADHILAGILGHELAHIFYRHHYGNSNDQAAESMLAAGTAAYMVTPLVGVIAGALAYDRHKKHDRIQEQEADLLGIQLTCTAGFSSQGILTAMQKFQENNNLGISFLSTHPSPGERIQTLSNHACNQRLPSSLPTFQSFPITTSEKIVIPPRTLFKTEKFAPIPKLSISANIPVEINSSQLLPGQEHIILAPRELLFIHNTSDTSAEVWIRY